MNKALLTLVFTGLVFALTSTSAFATQPCSVANLTKKCVKPPVSVPEPGTLALSLLGAGAFGIWTARRRKSGDQ